MSGYIDGAARFALLDLRRDGMNIETYGSLEEVHDRLLRAMAFEAGSEKWPEKLKEIRASIEGVDKFWDEPKCLGCDDSGQRYWHTDDCRHVHCALAGGVDDCDGQLEPCPSCTVGE